MVTGKMNAPFKFEGSLDEAIDFLEKAKDTQFFQEPHQAYLNLGQAYLMKGWLQKARTELEQALRLAPDNEYAKQILNSVELSLN